MRSHDLSRLLDKSDENRPYLRIPAIVGSDSADRGHPRKAYILVTAILCSGAMGQLLVFRERHDDDAWSLSRNTF